MALWSTVQGITVKGEGIELAPFVTGKSVEHRALVHKIRDAGGKLGGKELSEVFLLSNHGVVKHIRCNAQYPAIVAAAAAAGAQKPAPPQAPAEAAAAAEQESEQPKKGKNAKT